MSDRDKELVNLICQDCGNNFAMTYGRYRRLPKDNHWRCKTCTNIKRSQIFANLTEEQRRALREQRSSAAKKVWDNLSMDEYMRRKESQRKRWAKLSIGEKEDIMRNTRIGHAKYVQTQEFKQMMARLNHDRWEAMSTDDREKELLRLAKIRDDYWNSLTLDQKFKKMMHLWMNQVDVGPTEYIFNDLLKDYGMTNGIDYFWGYNTYPYINPEYFQIFGKTNNITGEENIPYHSWDFILFPNSDNPILIDIDGSVHSPKTMKFKRGLNNYTDRQKIDYRDSQRPYQIPDGMIAFIIQAHDNNLKDDTNVIRLVNNENIKYQEFVDLIHMRFTQCRNGDI